MIFRISDTKRGIFWGTIPHSLPTAKAVKGLSPEGEREREVRGERGGEREEGRGEKNEVK